MSLQRHKCMVGDLPMCHKALGPATEYGLRTTNPLLHLNDVNKGSTVRIALLILRLVTWWPVIAWMIPVVIDSPMCGWFGALFRLHCSVPHL